jgi:hypothetical protein
MRNIAIILTVCLSVTFAQEARWSYIHPGPGNSSGAHFFGCAVSADQSSYFAGSDSVAGRDLRFLVIGLNPDGTERWVGALEWGEANDVCIGTDGNVYACGEVRDSVFHRYFAVASWTQAGALRWVYLNRGDSTLGFAYALCPRPGGGVYACGRTAYPSSWVQFTTVALDSAGGERWVDTLGANPGSEEALAITTDGAGSVYAAGRSMPEGSSSNYATVRKLTAAGAVRWTHTTAQGGSVFNCITAGSDGNVYAGGQVGWDILAQSFDSAGTSRWTYQLNGPGSGVVYEGMNDIAWGPDNNLYCGADYARNDDQYAACIFSLRPDSTLRWLYADTFETRNGDNLVHAICCTPEGHVYAAGERGFAISRFSVWCLDTLGNLVWNYQKLPWYSDNAWCIAADTMRNIYVGGSMCNGSGAPRQAYALSFRAVPVNRGVAVGGTGNEYGQAICRTPDGGYGVVGYTNSFGAGGLDVYLVRFNSAGETLWTRTYGTSSDQYGWAIDACDDGGFAIAGFTQAGPTRWDLLLLQTDALGNQLWYKTYGRDSMIWAAYGLTRAPDNGFLAVGSRGPYGQNTRYDMLALKCNADGDSLWSRTYATDQMDQALCVAVCPDNGFLLGGLMGNISDLALVRIDSVGNEQWRKTYGGGGNDRADALCLTADSGFIIAGYTSASGTADAWLLKTNADGDTIWTRVTGGGGNDVATGVVEVPNFGYGVAGTTSTWGAGSNDFLFFSTDLSGNQLSLMTYGGSASDGAADICCATGGYALAGSTSSFGSGGSDVYLVLVPGPVGIEEPREESPRPQAPSSKREPTIVCGVLNLQSAIYNLQSEIALLDAAGRKVLALKPGANDVSGLAPGVYFVRQGQAQAQARVIHKVVIQR